MGGLTGWLRRYCIPLSGSQNLTLVGALAYICSTIILLVLTVLHKHFREHETRFAVYSLILYFKNGL